MNVARHAAPDEQVRQGVEDADRVELAIAADRQALPGELVNDVEHAERPAIVGPTLDEVIGPDMVGVLRSRPAADPMVWGGRASNGRMDRQSTDGGVWLGANP